LAIGSKGSGATFMKIINPLGAVDSVRSAVLLTQCPLGHGGARRHDFSLRE